MKVYRSRYRSPKRYPVKDRRKKRTGTRRRGSALATLLVVAGLCLVAYALLGQNLPLLDTATNDESSSADIRDTQLKLTVPKMDRVNELNVYDAPGSDESALETGAMHLRGTGFPWEQGSNVYIAGHRLGYPGTDSYLVFYDLDKLVEGDEVILTDADGTRYTYRVFRNIVVDPWDWSVAEPVPGKSIVSLQTCTLPDYTQRLVVQAALVGTA